MLVKDNQKTFKGQSIQVLIPAGIDLSSLPCTYVKNRKRGNDKNALFLNQFVIKNKGKGRPISEPIDLPSKWLKKVLGTNYHVYLEGLKRSGIITPVFEEYIYHQNGFKEQRVRAFSLANKRCKRYRLNLTPDTPLRMYSITDRRFSLQIQEARAREVSEIIARNPTANLGHKALKRLTIDTKAAIAYIKKEYNFNEVLHTTRWLLSRLSKREIRSIIFAVANNSSKRKKKKIIRAFELSDTETERVLNAIQHHQKILIRMLYVDTVDQIQKGRYDLISMIEDRRTARLYSTFTSSPRDLRPFMRLEGQKLVELDASNCQWHLFLGFLRDFLSTTPNTSQVYTQTPNTTQVHTQTHITTLPYLFPDLTFPEKSKLLEHEAEKLEQQLINKQFRERMAQKLGVDPKKAKKELIGNVLFGDPNKGGYNNWPSVKSFREDYPVLFQTISKLKTHWLNEGLFDYTPQERYKTLPVLLQKIEAKIFVEGMSECPAMFLTLHDAVITNENNLEVVRHQLEKSIRESGLKLKLNENTY